MNSFILCGMQFGDEGKGTFVDYLVHEKNSNCVVRYNGGSQASHTVVTPSGITHKFSQLGSGMFLEECHTYLTENMVINPDNLFVELEVFSNKTGISLPELLERIHIHENCFIVTPYHKLINKLRELSKGNERRGTVGTGVSEVKYLLSEPKVPQAPPLGLQVKDIFNTKGNNTIICRLEALQNHVFEFYKRNEAVIRKNIPEKLKEALDREIEFLLSPRAFLNIAYSYVVRFKHAPKELNLSRCVYNNYEIFRNYTNVVFEGSQGLLIDSCYGIKPNTTFLDTTNHFAMKIAHSKNFTIKVGIAKAFNSRHGLGVFPTEAVEVCNNISDENQDESFWNGKIRFGWFDAVLLRYAQSINRVEELYLSSIDKLDGFKTINICNEYAYNGQVDEQFEKAFAYYRTSAGQVIITGIKERNDSLGKYLASCTPRYIVVDGWNSDTTKVLEKSHLPQKCMAYIERLQELVNIPITLISVGPTRSDKIRMC